MASKGEFRENRNTETPLVTTVYTFLPVLFMLDFLDKIRYKKSAFNAVGHL